MLYETREQFQERFWSCVIKSDEYDGHWYWRGSIDAQRRPIFIFNDIEMYADVLAKIWNKDPERFIEKKYFDCSPLKCMNPYHLISYNDFSTFYYPPKLTLDASEKDLIISMYKSKKYTTVDLALEFNVSRRTISQLLVLPQSPSSDTSEDLEF